MAWREAEEANRIPNCHSGERSTWLTFSDEERRALTAHDYPALFALRAHPFLTLTLFIALLERDHPEPLGFRREYVRRLAHSTLPYPDIATWAAGGPAPRQRSSPGGPSASRSAR